MQALQALSAETKRQVDTFSVRALCNVLYGFACVHFWDEEVMETLAQRTLQLLPSFVGQARTFLTS